MKFQLISLFCIFTAPFVASELCNGFATCLKNVTTVNEGDKVTLLCSLYKPKPTQSCLWVTPDGTYVHPNSGKNNCSLNLNNVAPYHGGKWTCVESVKGVIQKDLKNNHHTVSGNLVVKGKCYVGNGALYAGRQTRTASGKKCALWSVANIKNNNHRAKNSMNYPEANITDALNYCRNPDGDAMPWCYTTDPNTRWEFCNISKCDNKCQGNSLSTFIKGCGNYHLECSGVIISSEADATTSKPTVRGDYANNMACSYNMTSPIGTIIKLTSVEFQLEHKYDTLMIYDGSKTGVKLGDYTGSTSFSVVSSSNQITLVFTTDATITDEGFRINFQVLGGCAPVDIVKCGKHNVNCAGNIYSQNYPADYNSHADCSYNLVAPPKAQIQFTSVSFHSEPNYDNLTIYDGSRYGKVLGFYNGINKNFSVITNQNSAVLRFLSDHAKTLSGFHIKYVVTPHGGNTLPTFAPTVPTTTPSCEETKTSGCGTYGGCRGVIRSQGYPENYPNKASCRYIIQGKANSIINIRSTTFNTEECCDKLTVYDGTTTKHAKPVGVFKGNNVKINLSVTGVATLVFEADFAKTDSGFELAYTITQPQG